MNTYYYHVTLDLTVGVESDHEPTKQEIDSWLRNEVDIDYHDYLRIKRVDYAVKSDVYCLRQYT